MKEGEKSSSLLPSLAPLGGRQKQKGKESGRRRKNSSRRRRGGAKRGVILLFVPLDVLEDRWMEEREKEREGRGWNREGRGESIVPPSPFLAPPPPPSAHARNSKIDGFLSLPPSCWKRDSLPPSDAVEERGGESRSLLFCCGRREEVPPRGHIMTGRRRRLSKRERGGGREEQQRKSWAEGREGERGPSPLLYQVNPLSNLAWKNQESKRGRRRLWWCLLTY